MDYGLEHNGRIYTPNTSVVSAEESAARNAAIEAAELARWAESPDEWIGYYHLPDVPTNTRPQIVPLAFASGNRVTTWLGTKIGRITYARIYRHNFGGLFVSLTMRGTNGAIYHGRASYDWGSIIRLHKAKV